MEGIFQIGDFTFRLCCPPEVTPPANFMSAEACSGIPATSAFNLRNDMPGMESLMNSRPELNRTGMLSLPYERVARKVVASAPAYMRPRDIPILNFSSASARVSPGNLPATNMLSTLRFILLLSLPSDLTLPLNCILRMFMTMLVVSGTLLYIISFVGERL